MRVLNKDKFKDFVGCLIFGIIIAIVIIGVVMNASQFMTTMR
jgi:hypothetical protein